MSETKRIAKWDNIKFVLIVCVVLGHFLARYDDYMNAKRLIFFIYLFHMPAFVFISGLFANRTIRERRYDKIFSFLLLYLVTKYALFLIQVIRGGKKVFSYFEMNDVSWYAFAVFIFYLVTIFFQQFDWKYMMAFSILVSCISGYASDIDTFLSLSRLLTFYPYFLMGYYLKSDQILGFVKRRGVQVISWIIFIGTALLVYTKIESVNWYLTILKGKHGYESLRQYGEYGFFLRLLWYVIAVMLTAAIISIVPSIDCFISKIGTRTMQIYALHYIPMLAFFGIFNGKEWLETISPNHHFPLVILVGIVVAVILSIKPVTIVMNAIIYPKRRGDGEK